MFYVNGKVREEKLLTINITDFYCNTVECYEKYS